MNVHVCVKGMHEEEREKKMKGREKTLTQRVLLATNH